MSFLDSLKNILSKNKESLDSPKEIIEKAQNLAESNQQMVSEVADRIKDAVPGQTDDKVVDIGVDKLTGK